MEIRHAVEADIDGIKKIYEKAFYDKEGILMYYPNFTEYVMNCIKHTLSYVAISDGLLCGMIFAYEVPDIEWGKTVHIEVFAVLPNYQKMGIGTALMKHLKENAQEKGYIELSLRTACYLDAYEIYKKIGFRDMRSDRRFMVMKIQQEVNKEQVDG